MTTPPADGLHVAAAPADAPFGTSETGLLMARVDWAATPLGDPATWPASLWTCVNICMASRFPMILLWGPRFVQIYNDAFRPTLGADKHPAAMGLPAEESWPEIWDLVGPMLRGALDRNEATWSADQLLPMRRNGYLEECYLTFSYVPVRDESGASVGIFTAVAETTREVVGRRRLDTLHRLAAAGDGVHGAHAACRTAADVLEDSTADVPFAILYLLEDGLLVPVAATGLAADRGHPAVTPGGEDPDPWGLRRAVSARTPHDVACVEAWGDRLAALDEDERPREARVVPLARAGGEGVLGAVVLGASPSHAVDDEYRGFLDLAGGHVSARIHDAVAREEERRRADELAALDRAKTDFFSNVSHEFRTPLSLLLGPVSDALAELDTAAPDVQRERLELAARNAHRLLRLVNTLLDFSRIEAGRAEAAREPTDLAALTVDVSSAFRSAMESAGLRLDVRCAPLGADVAVDRAMWEKIVLNLLSNALKFTFTGGVTVTLDAEGADAVLRVADTGVGVPADEVPRLFERFHRVRGARARTHEGTGIGLALVRELARLHGGDAEAESTEGRGTTITVRVPLRAAGGVTAPGAAEPREAFLDEAAGWLAGPVPAAVAPVPAGGGDRARPLGARGARIVLADDNADMRAYLTRLLGRRWAVEAYADGAAALAAAREDPPDLVMSDVMMPGLDGFALLRALRADGATRGVPIILLSARAGAEAVSEGLAAGADDYLLKPFGAEELMTRVGAHLELSAMRARLARGAEEAAAGRARAEEQARFRVLAENSVDMVGRYTPDSTVLYVSPAAWTLLGYTPEEMRGRRLTDFLHPDDRPEVAERVAEITAGTTTHLSRWVRRDGRVIWCESAARAVHAPDGSVTEIQASTRDVTDRVEAEEALRRERDFSDSLVAALHDGIALLSDAGVVVRANARLAALTQSDPVGRPFADLLSPVGGEAWTELMRTPAERRPREIDSDLRTGDDVVPVLLTVTQVVPGSGGAEGLLVTVKDMRERLAAQRAKSEFMTLASHELRTPLTSVIGFLDLAVERLPDDADPRLRGHLDLALRNAGRLGRLVEDVLELSRGDTGRLSMDMTEVDIAGLLRDAVEAARPAAMAARIDLGLDAPSLPAVRGDRNRLRQVVDNVLSNAIKFTPEGGRVDVRAAADDGRVHVEVADTGPGIPPEDRERVFERFFRGREAHRRAIPGSGLGLPIARMILDAHSGSVEVVGDGPGTRVRVTLPAVAP